jgi:hypothetical protein
MGVKIAVLNESWEPLADIVVEAFDTETGEMATSATTGTNGIAIFDDVDFPVSTILFKPRNTRGQGPKGGAEPEMTDSEKALEEAEKPTYGKTEADYRAEEDAKAKEEGDDTGGQGMMSIQLLGPGSTEA